MALLLERERERNLGEKILYFLPIHQLIALYTEKNSISNTELLTLSIAHRALSPSEEREGIICANKTINPRETL